MDCFKIATFRGEKKCHAHETESLYLIGVLFKPSPFFIWKSPLPRADGPYAKWTCVFTIHRIEVLKTRNFSQWITKMMKLLQCLASH